MKLIVNTTNIVVGGGIQVSLSFIEELKKFKDHEYHLFLSSQVSKQIDTSSFPENFSFYYFNISPSSITKGHIVRKELNRLEKSINPDLVFTVFGPAYWKPKSLHISGFANGWCYNPNSIAHKRLTFVKRLKSRISALFKNFEIRKADYLIVETKDAKSKINKYINIPLEKIFVVGNTYHPVYSKYISNKVELPITESNIFKLLVLSAFYPHKNLEIINEVIPILKSRTERQFIFYLTIGEDDYIRNFHDPKYIINLGPQKIDDCPRLYEKSDALFLPTLLETYSANYPEAMIMKKPIITSGFDFAKDVCKDAALYIDPLDPEDIANKIIQLSESKDLYDALIKKGEQRLMELETSESRAVKYMNIFQKIISDK
jgi:glycosyltransferase involved in cell wall biosynthesis